jgi:hypothetical protein
MFIKDNRVNKWNISWQTASQRLPAAWAETITWLLEGEREYLKHTCHIYSNSVFPDPWIKKYYSTFFCPLCTLPLPLQQTIILLGNHPNLSPHKSDGPGNFRALTLILLLFHLGWPIKVLIIVSWWLLNVDTWPIQAKAMECSLHLSSFWIGKMRLIRPWTPDNSQRKERHCALNALSRSWLV